MSKILIATEKPFASAAVDQIKNILEGAGHNVAKLEKYSDKKQLIDAVSDAEAVIIRSDKIDKEVIENAKKLKIVVRAGAGYDNVELDAATQNGVVVMNTPGQNSNAVAELAFGMMVYMARKKFNGSSGTELRSKKLGIHAYGYIGKLVAQIAKGFGMEIYAFDPFISEEKIKVDGVIPVKSAEELYKIAQYVSLHIPATAETKNSIDAKLLSLMPKGATLVNTARKEVINEAGLLKVFADRDDFCYLTDVAPACASELESKYTDRYYATPKKMGAQTAEANYNAGVAAANQIVNFLKNGDVKFQVNK